MNLKIKRLTKTAKLPVKNNSTDAGIDIFTDEEVTIHAGETVAISTGVALDLPVGTYGRLKARSGLTLQTPLRVLEGTIDCDYRGEIKALAEIKGFEFDFHKASMAQALETYQEDRAFLNRIKTVSSYRLQTAEIQRLFRIAERGMKVRYEQGSSSK